MQNIVILDTIISMLVIQYLLAAKRKHRAIQWTEQSYYTIITLISRKRLNSAAL